jgi:hypothetical protein
VVEAREALQAEVNSVFLVACCLPGYLVTVVFDTTKAFNATRFSV